MWDLWNEGDYLIHCYQSWQGYLEQVNLRLEELGLISEAVGWTILQAAYYWKCAVETPTEANAVAEPGTKKKAP